MSAIHADTEGVCDILAFLAEQDLPATPINFELGYIRRNHPTSLAARTIATILAEDGRISQVQADYVVGAHRTLDGSTARQQPDEEIPGHAQLRHQTLQLADVAGAAMSATGQFGRDLAEQLSAVDRADGPHPFAASISRMIDRAGETERRLNVARTQIETLNSELAMARNDAARDALTGLVNRRGLQIHLDAIEPQGCTALAICDIDRFKTINDRHGHQVGDRVIQAVAETIATSCEPHIVARWGGEEFVVLMDGVELAEANALIEGARDTLQKRSFRVRETGEALEPVTFSGGVVMVDPRGWEEAITAADALLYQAKLNGRDQILIALPDALAA